MKFTVDKFTVDLGVTFLENIFVNNYLSLANGDQLKVYIYGCKLAQEHADDMSVTQMATELDMTPERIETAWKFWIDHGIVVAEGEEYKLLSLRQLYLGATDFDEEAEPVVEESKEGESLQEMFIAIQKVLDTDLMPNEIIRISEAKNEYAMEPALVAHAFEYSAKETGKKNLNYVLGILRNWNFDGIHTMEDWEKHQEKQEKPERPRRIKRNYHRGSAKNAAVDERYDEDDVSKLLKERQMKNYEKTMGEEK